jgi:uncharacterized protein (TIGR00369 family)
VKVSNELQDTFRAVPLNKHLNLTLVSRSAESATVSIDPAPELLQEEGVIHGAIITAIADTSAIYVFYPDLPKNTRMTSIEFKINFLAPGLLNDGVICAVSKVIRKGRTIGVCDVEISQNSKLIAKGLFTYLFYPRKQQT